MKACDKMVLMSTYNFNFEVTSQVKVRSNTQDWTYIQQHGLRDFVLGISRHKDGQDCEKITT